jgi:hypothetical protein
MGLNIGTERVNHGRRVCYLQSYLVGHLFLEQTRRHTIALKWQFRRWTGDLEATVAVLLNIHSSPMVQIFGE